MAFPAHANITEKRIITAILKRALAAGYSVSVFDGEEWALRRSVDLEAITAECHATDETTLRFWDATRNQMGSIWLVHGNEDDVISDHTDNSPMAALVKGL
ncbi:hypothetical protein [Mesorhizobium sp. M1252]|uniref:hypothetical protein n=1 Tax=Mesorhizobium sp. M1252 TaxID=2957073 RepID=UPI003338C09A